MDHITLLEKLLRLYSPSTLEADAVNFLVGAMRDLGFEAHVDDVGNAVGAYGKGPETVMLLGHIDTVSGFIPVKREADKIWGRGACDAKGPLATFVTAAHRARAAVEAHGLRLVVVGAVGEEADSRGAQYLKDKYLPKYTLIGEPSSWDKVTLGYRGSAWYRYHVRRTRTHTAARMERACEAAVNFWNRVVQWAETRNAAYTKAFDMVAPNLNGMNSTSDGFVDTATLSFNARLPLELGLEQFDSALHTLVQDADLSQLDGVPAYRTDKNSPLVRACLAAIRRQGGQPSFSLKSGTSDMNTVGPVWGTPIVAYGPGDSTLDHTPEEHLLIAEYERAIAVLTDVLTELR